MLRDSENDLLELRHAVWYTVLGSDDKTGDGWRGISCYDCLGNSLLWVLASNKYNRALFCCKGRSGLLQENAGIYKFMQNAEPLCGKMRGFAGICKAQFVLFGTFCGKMRGFVNASQSL